MGVTLLRCLLCCFLVSVQLAMATSFDVAPFQQQIHRAYRPEGPELAAGVSKLVHNESDAVFALTDEGVFCVEESVWHAQEFAPEKRPFGGLPWYESLQGEGVTKEAVRDVATRNGEIAVAASSGLYLGDGDRWTLALPHAGNRRWAPVDVRAVVFDRHGQLWFACPQGVGRRDADGVWTLFTGKEGLPYNDFTAMAAGPDGVWFGTTNGAIHFTEGNWEFRQGRRWLLDNHVKDVTVTSDGHAWFATEQGVSCIAREPMTLAKKAARYEAQIDQYHRRTKFGYVTNARMTSPDALESATASPSDNDGHYTGIYLASASLGYAATGNPALKEKAHRAFDALAFLSEVTQGGSHPAPKGFIARCVRPTDGPNPNEQYSHAYDRKRRERDARWKQMDRRWPTDATGEWYWLCDSSSDELDGHYFGYGTYFDRVCETEAERDRVRAVVRRVTDHLIDNGYYMVDYDGQPTRWGHFAPDSLNRDGQWWFESGLNAQSILTYLQVAHHVTGDAKYRQHYLKLAWDEGYAMKTVTTPKIQFGPGSLGQGDDNMAYMNYYHLIRYETDPKLLSMYYNSIYWYWHIEKYERNPYFNFIYAACVDGKSRTDQWRTIDLSPPREYMAYGVDTLKRFPLDLVDYGLSNAHRIDVIPLGDHTQGAFSGQHEGEGHGHDGLVFPIDEQHALIWGEDPWHLDHKGNELRLRDPVPYLIAYYMGLAHGFIVE